MGIFSKRPTILQKYEDQFKVRDMQNKKIFHDLFVRVGDPEELRSYVLQLVQEMNWKTPLNELTKWEEPDTEGIFRGGRLKPVRNILKSYKEFVKGPKFPIIWKALAVIGILFLGFYIYTLINAEAGIKYNKNLILMITPLWFVASLLIYMIKEKVMMAVWVKIAGIYNIANEETDVRIVIAADAEKADKEAFNALESDITEMYNVLSRRYVKKRGIQTHAKKSIAKEMGTRAKDPAVKILKSLSELDKQIASLDNQLATGKLKEDTYKQVKSDMKDRKNRLQTLIDLLTTD